MKKILDFRADRMADYLIASYILKELKLKYGLSIVALICHSGYLVQESCYNNAKIFDKDNIKKLSINKNLTDIKKHI